MTITPDQMAAIREILKPDKAGPRLFELFGPADSPETFREIIARQHAEIERLRLELKHAHSYAGAGSCRCGWSGPDAWHSASAMWHRHHAAHVAGILDGGTS